MIEPPSEGAPTLEAPEQAHARAYRRLEQLEILHRISTRIAANLEPEALFHEIVEAIHQGLGYTNVTLLLLDAEAQVLRASAWTGYGSTDRDRLQIPLNQGVTGWVASHRQPLLIPDVRADSRYIGVDASIRSELAVPVQLGERLLGVLNVESTELDAFTSEDLSILTILATQLAVAIENARLYQQTHRALRDSTALFKITQSLATTLEPGGIFALIVAATKDTLPQPHATVLHLLDEGSAELVPKYSSERGAEVQREMRLRLGQGLAGLAVAEGRTIYSPDVALHPGFAGASEPLRFRSLLVAPLLADGQPVGAITITSPKSNAFPTEAQAFLAAVAAQAAVAIRNARAYARQLSRAQVLSSLMETVAFLNRERDVGRLLERLARRAADTFSLPAAAIWTPSADGRLMEIRAAHGLSQAYVKSQRLTLPRARKVLQRALEGSGYWYSPDIGQQPLGDPDLIRREHITSVLALPLVRDTALIGALVLYARREVREFESSEIELARTFADQARIALENAELIAQLEQTQDQLRELNAELEKKVDERTAALQQTQERLLGAERLAAMGQFGAGIAHELRNPLGILSNSLFYLSRRFKDEEEPKLRRHLTIMDKEIQRSQQIITDLIAFARTQRLNLQETDLNAVIRECLERCPPPENVEVASDLRELPPVAADYRQLQQVLVNLVQNAYQAMPKGGRLTVRTEAAEGGGQLKLEDTGEGIARENLHRIFEPLFTTKAQGVGLGLAIVKHLVEAHNGRLTAESTEGQGTSFALWLPGWSGAS